MIARIWRGQASTTNAGTYRQHVTEGVFPKLQNLFGHRGAYLLAQPIDGGVEFLAVTLWDSIEAVQQFAGKDPNKAVVEPEARAVLSEFDDSVRHYEVVYRSNSCA